MVVVVFFLFIFLSINSPFVNNRNNCKNNWFFLLFQQIIVKFSLQHVRQWYFLQSDSSNGCLKITGNAWNSNCLKCFQMEVGVLLRKVSYLNIRNNLGGKRKLIISRSNFWDSLKSFVGTKFNSIWVEIENLKISDYPKKVFFFWDGV